MSHKTWQRTWIPMEPFRSSCFQTWPFKTHAPHSNLKVTSLLIPQPSLPGQTIRPTWLQAPGGQGRCPHCSLLNSPKLYPTGRFSLWCAETSGNGRWHQSWYLALPGQAREQEWVCGRKHLALLFPSLRKLRKWLCCFTPLPGKTALCWAVPLPLASSATWLLLWSSEGEAT